MNFLKTKTGQIFAICVLSFVVYSFAFSAPFKILDDHYSIIAKEEIRSFSSIKEIFTTSFFGRDHYYRPLVYFTFMLENHLFGLNSLFFHLNNWILHAATAIVVYFLMIHLTLNQRLSFIIAILFSIHPINSQSVWNIADRAILLSGFFSLSAFLYFCVWLKSKKNIWLVISLVSFFIGLFAKESSMMLPGVLVLHQLILNKEEEGSIKTSVLRVLPYFLIAGGFLLFRKSLGIFIVYKWPNFRDQMLGFMTFLRGTLTYWRMAIFPYDVHFDRSRFLFVSFMQWQLIATVVTYVLGICTLIKFRKLISPLIFFFLCWFYLELLPVSQLISSIGVSGSYISIGEQFLYTASVAMISVVVLSFRTLVDINFVTNTVSKNVPKVLGYSFFIFLIIITISQTITAQSPILVYKRSLEYNQVNDRILYSLGLEYARVNRFDLAEEQFQKFMVVRPNSSEGKIALGLTYSLQKKYKEAIEVLEAVEDPGELKGLYEKNLKKTYKLYKESKEE